VQEVEQEIQLRKGEVERLIQDMKSANLESLTISPPDETRAFLDGTCFCMTYIGKKLYSH
jgi:hypothetical protein